MTLMPEQNAARLWKLRLTGALALLGLIAGGLAVFCPAAAIVLGGVGLAAYFAAVLWATDAYLRSCRVFTGRILEATRGIWMRRRTAVPRRRILGLRLTRAPDARLFGLCSVTVLTAGGALHLFPMSESQVAALERALETPDVSAEKEKRR